MLLKQMLNIYDPTKALGTFLWEWASILPKHSKTFPDTFIGHLYRAWTSR